ncbi:MAG: hypothetical protein HOK67_28825 [Deltaproteobacteria bacterium]|jgi:hypothetical protein|nr:hypothetical protein [Deltaproteobacteria bacterium]MBT4642778.1 hypothetical protein [Deltaproteobacteria bacterium]MBT6503904.1 hypothetical protein [Deltaproteobacteria bacterium]MBT7155974.1 hypothetical protein [Deltaproteobacteria bacterium]MBT7712528.1 hypothetical protein [Deltaproteobacteria bacterium]
MNKLFNPMLFASITTVVGGNIFSGADHYEDREFGMLRNDDNAFARLKYNF